VIDKRENVCRLLKRSISYNSILFLKPLLKMYLRADFIEDNIFHFSYEKVEQR
jgi:hypothetical protein